MKLYVTTDLAQMDVCYSPWRRERRLSEDMFPGMDDDDSDLEIDPLNILHLYTRTGQQTYSRKGIYLHK